MKTLLTQNLKEKYALDQQNTHIWLDYFLHYPFILVKPVKDYLTQLKSNLVRKPQGNDRAQVKAIYSGLCEVSVINHYYLALMLNDKVQKMGRFCKCNFSKSSSFGTH